MRASHRTPRQWIDYLRGQVTTEDLGRFLDALFLFSSDLEILSTNQQLEIMSMWETLIDELLYLVLEGSLDSWGLVIYMQGFQYGAQTLLSCIRYTVLKQVLNCTYMWTLLQILKLIVVDKDLSKWQRHNVPLVPHLDIWWQGNFSKPIWLAMSWPNFVKCSSKYRTSSQVAILEWWGCWPNRATTSWYFVRSSVACDTSGYISKIFLKQRCYVG